MPSPGAPAPLRLPIEDSYFELLADTLESLDLKFPPLSKSHLDALAEARARLEAEQ